MSQNSGPFLVSSHGHPAFNPRAPPPPPPPPPSSSSSSTSSSKRISNGLMTGTNPSIAANMALSSSPSQMRPGSSMGPMKPGTAGLGPMDKSNSMPYSTRYGRKPWPMPRGTNEKNIRGHDDHEAPYLRPGIPGHAGPVDSMNASSFTIEPSTDDDEADDIYFSSRHMAAARFQRNQRLLCEIFNEVCIPDLRSNVNVDRILTLRRQVDALKTHCETFEKDLNELEEKHVDKKRKFVDANEKFHHEYADASSTNLTREKINEILQKHEAMEKLQKEKQLLLQQQQQQQQQQAVVTPAPPAVTSQPVIPPATKTEPIAPGETPQQQPAIASVAIPPPPPPPSVQPAPIQLPPPQPIPTPLPPQPVPTPIPPQHLPVQSQIAPSQPQLPPPVMQQLPPPPPPQQQQQQQMNQQQPPPPQGYPMMHPGGGGGGGGYPPAPGYGHPQQSQYRPQMNQRPTHYPPNVQWQQQQQQQQQPPQQQQWQPNAYDPRYYHSYPPNVQWPQQQQQQQQQQQWPPNQPPTQQQQMGGVPPQQQQQMGVAPPQQQPPPHMRGPPQQSAPPPQMYANGVNYGYGSGPAGWNGGAPPSHSHPHPSQQYAYPSNPSYDPSGVPVPPQQQYYPPPPGYDYGPPPPQQQQQTSLPPPPQQPPSSAPPQMN